ncbi:MAG: hypothetical protein HY672_03105 [Chloroflexi bacterium]|nr:hypothetical protein [Chloroflexota bacterium]
MDGYTPGSDPLSNVQAIAHLKRAMAQGREWMPALLEAMALWTLPEEVYQDQHHRYLLDGEAFDLLLLAERLLAEVDGLVPKEEKRDLLLSGDVSHNLTENEFKGLLGPQKYSAYLNYWYGVVVEEAILQSAEEEERKRLHSGGLRGVFGVKERAFLHVYGAEREELQRQFREGKGYPESASWTQTEAKEFTYWLFKYRLIHGEGARVASDTRKGLLFLQKRRARARKS